MFVEGRKRKKKKEGRKAGRQADRLTSIPLLSINGKFLIS